MSYPKGKEGLQSTQGKQDVISYDHVALPERAAIQIVGCGSLPQCDEFDCVYNVYIHYIARARQHLAAHCITLHYITLRYIALYFIALLRIRTCVHIYI